MRSFPFIDLIKMFKKLPDSTVRVVFTESNSSMRLLSLCISCQFGSHNLRSKLEITKLVSFCNNDRNIDVPIYFKFQSQIQRIFGHEMRVFDECTFLPCLSMF